MIRSEIITKFREENSELTERSLPDTILYSWLEEGNREICALTRCIVCQNGTTIETSEDDQCYDLSDKIDNFFMIDTYSGSGVLYNGKRLEEKTMSQLDQKSPNWRSRSSGTPKAFYQRGKWLYLDRPIDSNTEDIVVYCVLRPNDFNDDVMPFNELEHLIPYHYAFLYYRQKRAEARIGKTGEEVKALQEYDRYISNMKKKLIGSRSGVIQFIPSGAYK